LGRRPLALPPVDVLGGRPSPRSQELRAKALFSTVLGQQRRRLRASFPSLEALLCCLGSRRPSASLPSSRRCLCWVVVTGWGGLRRKPLPVCRPMMATPSGAVFLVGGIICSLLPPSPPMAGRLIGGSFCVPALLHFMQCRLRCLGRGGCCAAQLRCLLLLADGGSLALADALPPYSCSLVDALPPVVTSSLADALPLFLYAGGYFAAVVVLFGGCFATVSCFKLALLGIFGDNFLCRSSSSGGFCLGGLCGESSPSVFPLLPACCISGYGRLCACLYFFFSVSFIFSPLCSCVGQVLFGRNKFVSVTAFFLMKNVLRLRREKISTTNSISLSTKIKDSKNKCR